MKIKKKYDLIDTFIKKLKTNDKPSPGSGVSILATPAKFSTPVGLYIAVYICCLTCRRTVAYCLCTLNSYLLTCWCCEGFKGWVTKVRGRWRRSPRSTLYSVLWRFIVNYAKNKSKRYSENILRVLWRFVTPLAEIIRKLYLYGPVCNWCLSYPTCLRTSENYLSDVGEHLEIWSPENEEKAAWLLD